MQGTLIRTSDSRSVSATSSSEGSLIAVHSIRAAGSSAAGGNDARRSGAQDIFINDGATSEIDYSGLHPVLLYAEKGIDYWGDINADPYEIPTPDFLDSPAQTRKVVKQLLLTALNAKDETSTFAAFRDQADIGSVEKRLTNAQLGRILDELREKHAPIAERMASDAGIDLMNTDSKIAEKIVRSFIDQGMPILTVHDSYIVPYGFEQFLEETMTAAFQEVTGVKTAKVKEETFDPWDYEPADFESAIGFDHKAWEADLEGRFNPTRTERYKLQMRRFEEHFGPMNRIVREGDYDPPEEWYR